MPAKKAPTFEQALERLETIASGLEDGSASARLRIKDQDDPASESAPDKSI